MILLTVNAGSSSIKLTLFQISEQQARPISKTQSYCSMIHMNDVLNDFCECNDIQQVSAISHRIVHGGSKFVAPTALDESVEAEIEAISDLCPLHNPLSLDWVKVCRERFGNNVHEIAVFDTGFFSQLPDVAQEVALPRELSQRYGLKRYGFHGLAHKAMWKQWREQHMKESNNTKVISVQLGSGCSITATKDGKPVDTSMGFSPLEGLIMATRSGDIDPGIILYLQRTAGLSLEEITKILNQESGLLGLSGVSSVVSELLECENPAAKLAIDLYCYRIQKYIASYIGVLEGVDAILFGGGVAENCPTIVERILKHFAWYGITLQQNAHSQASVSGKCITTDTSTAGVWMLNVDEAHILAEEALPLLI